MEHFVIEGGYPLRGTITPVGNKNAALPLLAVALLTDEPLILHNVPDIGDVRTKLELIRRLGVEATPLGASSWKLQARAVGDRQPDEELSRRIRTAPLLAGPLLARRGYVTIPRPGGDRIGRRRLDTHFQALQALGAEIEIAADRYMLRCRELVGADIFLDEMSVTGTEQAVIAATLARGTTIIRNAASEPHVQDVCRCLNAMGARISGIGSDTLVVEGVNALHGAEYTIGPDFMEVGSFIGLAAATRSAIRIKDARPEEHRITRITFNKLGVTWEVDGNDIVVPAEQALEIQDDLHGAIPKIDDRPWPGFPTDLMSIALVVATQARGTILIHEWMFENRLFFVDRLISMGARIVLCDPHRAVVVGPSQLHGEVLTSPDIRAGMALLIAALAAQGTSIIQNIGQIDRGYERIEERLRALGARIERRS
ncbi:UDP-N-acetylglucosamine 1-carboxyvinyltransferase [Kallotenue papyrolyticum]|uniref:UDP-N-acetylglucosamine 1-carboxyvinyltransferase n=1 Tax=Kallotenue papyrolyticum TaxID=1325125 RepID=UPI0004924422|nr:UDP-N-acetylglucosamine 1-carboxyvinyltransferase [Kallotenue papyrolyticum]